MNARVVVRRLRRRNSFSKVPWRTTETKAKTSKMIAMPLRPLRSLLVTGMKL